MSELTDLNSKDNTDAQRQQIIPNPSYPNREKGQDEGSGHPDVNTDLATAELCDRRRVPTLSESYVSAVRAGTSEEHFPSLGCCEDFMSSEM